VVGYTTNRPRNQSKAASGPVTLRQIETLFSQA
jgi:hypothetical protein